MIFGVRMYEDTVARNGNEANRWCAEPSSTVNTPHHREPEEESLQLANFPEPLFDVCKKVLCPNYLLQKNVCLDALDGALPVIVVDLASAVKSY